MPTCIAYTEADAICRQPATVLDVRRGGMVCDTHARHDKPEPRTEA
jgi:hypothetical protein